MSFVTIALFLCTDKSIILTVPTQTHKFSLVLLLTCDYIYLIFLIYTLKIAETKILIIMHNNKYMIINANNIKFLIIILLDPILYR